MTREKMFKAYGDESGTFDHRFQSVAIVSGEDYMINELRKKLRNEINEKGIQELKFYEIKGYQSPKAKVARQFINYTIREFAHYKRIRIDVVTLGCPQF